MLNDSQIRWFVAKGGLVITPLPADNCFQPASVDLTLGSSIRLYPQGTMKWTDLRKPIDHSEERKIPADGFMIQPGGFLLASTVERIELPNQLVARVEGKSSLGRAGLMVHVTAGFVDPGFKGHITLELKNLNVIPVVIYTGMKITQLAFEEIPTPARCYGHPDLGSKYQNSEGTVGVR
jgi:dCTP deaminase